MENREKKQRRLTVCLLAVYLIFLTWSILFKMQFSIGELDRSRSLNLIPFHGSEIVNGRVDFLEIFGNILAFLPFGIYIGMLRNRWTFWKKILPIAAASLFYEGMQYLLAIGASDITDVIGNTFGGILGIAVYAACRRIFRTDFRTNRILNGIALFGTFCAAALSVLVAVRNS